VIAGPLFLLAVLTLGYAQLLAALVGQFDTRDSAGREGGRKIVHVGVFTGAVPAHLLLGFWGVVTYGGVFFLVLLAALARETGSTTFGVLTRRSDGPHAPRYVAAPLLSTALGGLVGATLVGTFSIVGFLVCGWGDAMGDVVGSRWGRRTFSPPLARRGGPDRSLEGSAAVFLFGSAGAWFALVLLGFSPSEVMGTALACGVAGALAEGLSSPGTDNFWVQVLPSLLAWGFLG